jgi:hypothetical protein
MLGFSVVALLKLSPHFFVFELGMEELVSCCAVPISVKDILTIASFCPKNREIQGLTNNLYN